MSDHKYTLDEIDRMRAALWRKFEPPRCNFPPNVMIPNDYIKKEQESWEYARRMAEDELRTCMVGGVRPEELETKYPAKKSA